jgi:hypothetical protein
MESPGTPDTTIAVGRSEDLLSLGYVPLPRSKWLATAAPVTADTGPLTSMRSQIDSIENGKQDSQNRFGAH